MPVDFLTEEQVAAYCRFAAAPSRSDLERYFLLDDGDLKLVNTRRPNTHRLGFVVALGTRALPRGRSCPTLEKYPATLSRTSRPSPASRTRSCLAAYAARAMTPCEHT